MPLISRINLATLLLTLAATLWAEPRHHAPIFWSVTQTDLIGAHTPTVMGSPHVSSAPPHPALFFNGSSDGLLVPTNPLAGWSQFTVEILFKPEEGGLAEQRFVHIQDLTNWRVMIETRLDGHGGWWLDTFLGNERIRQPLIDPQRVHPTGRWYWVALTYDGQRMTHYIDGEQELTAQVAFGPMGPGQTSLGVRQNKVYWFKGGISALRFHPTALTPPQLQRGPLQ